MTTPILCFDLDGTLLDERGRMHPRDAEILAGETDACFIPTTGRPLHAVKRMFARHGLFLEQPLPFPLILQNGSLLYRPHERLEAYFPFPAEIQQTCLETALKATHHAGQVTFLFLGQDTIHALWLTPYAQAAAASYDFLIQTFKAGSWSRSFSKIMCISQAPQVLKGLHQLWSGLPVECAYSMATILEITPQGINKGVILKRLQAALGLGSSPIYAAGDGGNDLALFELAEVSFAPQQSPAAIRAAASQVVDIAESGILAPMLRACGR